MSDAVMPGEEWRPVVGWETLYEVSSMGRVRSLPRLVPGGMGSMAVRGGIILKRSMDAGRARVNLHDRDVVCCRRIYVLVAEAFLGPCPAGQVVRHLDDISDNDVVTNLAYGTPKENAEDAIRNSVTLLTARCYRGHLKSGPNRHSNGRCRACTLATSTAAPQRRRGVDVNVTELADQHYVRLMGGAGRE